MPATSANLGPGFDVLGLSLDLYDEVSVELIDGADEVNVVGEGADDLPKNSEHLIVKTVRDTLAALGVSVTGLRLDANNRIPHARGLGSSSAAIVAGIALARELAGSEKINQDQFIDMAGKIEGHPDNIAPCILGGGTISWIDESGHHAVRLSVHSEIVPVLAIPNFRIPTEKARAVLPEKVSHDEAIFNIARSSLLVHALTTDPDLLFVATEDKIHQRQRAEMMPDSWRLLNSLRQDGLAATISGAGPAVLILASPANAINAVEKVTQLDSSFTALTLKVDQGGVQALA